MKKSIKVHLLQHLKIKESNGLVTSALAGYVCNLLLFRYTGCPKKVTDLIKVSVKN